MKPLESILCAFLNLHPEDAAKAFETIDFNEAVRAFKNLPVDVAAALLERVNMGAAALSGAVIPLALKSLGRDPAQSASIFLTTVTDIVGFGSFLGFAVLLSSWIM